MCYNLLHFINLCLNSSDVPLFSMVKKPSSVFPFNWIVLFMFLFWISNIIPYGESSSVKLNCLLKYDKRSEVWCCVVLMKVAI